MIFSKMAKTTSRFPTLKRAGSQDLNPKTGTTRSYRENKQQRTTTRCIICLKNPEDLDSGYVERQKGQLNTNGSCSQNSQDKLRRLFESLEIFMESELHVDDDTTYYICDLCEVVVERLHQLRLTIERYLLIMKGVQLKLFSLIVESEDVCSPTVQDGLTNRSNSSVPASYKKFRSKIVKRFNTSVCIPDSERRLANSYMKALLPDTSNSCRRLKTEFQEKFSNWLNFSDSFAEPTFRKPVAAPSSERLVPRDCNHVNMSPVYSKKVLPSECSEKALDATSPKITLVQITVDQDLPSEESMPSFADVSVFKDEDSENMEASSTCNKDSIVISEVDNRNCTTARNEDVQSESYDESYDDAFGSLEDGSQEEVLENIDENHQDLSKIDKIPGSKSIGEEKDERCKQELVDEPSASAVGIEDIDTSSVEFDKYQESSDEEWRESVQSTPPPSRRSKRVSRKDGPGYTAIEDDMLKCNECDETFFTVTAVKRHLHIFHNEHRQSTIREGRSSSLSPCRAVYGENEFTYGNFKFQRYTNDIYKCPVCPSQSKLPSRLIWHVRKKHRDILQIRGVPEKMIEPSEDDTIRLPKPENRRTPVHVEIEPNKFIYKNQITYEFDGVQYSCTYCGFNKTESLTKMKDHVREHLYTERRHQVKPRKTDKRHKFYPKLYGSNFINYSGFNIQIVDGVYTCPDCPIKLNEKYKMFAHVRTIHILKEKYICETCGKEFKRGDLLRGHCKTHKRKDEPPLLCSVCGKVFKRELTLRQHEKSHNSNIQGHPCAYCPKVCSTRNKLGWHKKKYHREFMKPKVSKNNPSTSSLADPPTVPSEGTKFVLGVLASPIK